MSIIRKEFYGFIDVFLNTISGLNHLFIRFPSELDHLVMLCDDNLDEGRVVSFMLSSQGILVELESQLFHLGHVGSFFFSLDQVLHGLDVDLEF